MNQIDLLARTVGSQIISLRLGLNKNLIGLDRIVDRYRLPWTLRIPPDPERYCKVLKRDRRIIANFKIFAISFNPVDLAALKNIKIRST